MSQATDMLAAYIAAEQAILLGKKIRFMDRWVEMEDLPAVQKGRRDWEVKVVSEQVSQANVPSIGGAKFKLANFNNAT